MSKELRALNRIKDFMSINAHHWKQDIGMIETALKRLEKIDDLLEDITVDNLDTGLQFVSCIIDLRQRDKKKLKALEIIKENLPIKFDESNNSIFIELGLYNCDKYRVFLPKEEFDLLKEVLK